MLKGGRWVKLHTDYISTSRFVTAPIRPTGFLRYVLACPTGSGIVLTRALDSSFCHLSRGRNKVEGRKFFRKCKRSGGTPNVTITDHHKGYRRYIRGAYYWGSETGEKITMVADFCAQCETTLPLTEVDYPWGISTTMTLKCTSRGNW